MKALALLALLISAAAAACSSSALPCGGFCPTGEYCNSEENRCLPIRPDACPEDLGRYLSLAIDSGGRLWFSSYTESYGDLVVGVENPDGTLQCDYVDGRPAQVPYPFPSQTPPPIQGDDVGRWSSLALDAGDRPHVAYFDSTHGTLKLAERDDAGWHIATLPEIEDDGGFGRGASFALDSAGQPRVAYYHDARRELRLARRFAGGRWEFEVVDGGSEVWPALAIDAARPIRLIVDSRDREWLAYRDQASGALKIAGQEPSGLSRWELDPGPDAGAFVCAARDPAGNMALAYTARDGSLRYAANRSGALQFVTALSGWAADESGRLRQAPAGQHCALAFGSDGRPRIAVLDAARLALRVVTLDGAKNPAETLDAEGPVGFFNAMASRESEIRAGSCRLQRNASGQLVCQLRLYRIPGGTGKGGATP